MGYALSFAFWIFCWFYNEGGSIFYHSFAWGFNFVKPKLLLSSILDAYYCWDVSLLSFAVTFEREKEKNTLNLKGMIPQIK